MVKVKNNIAPEIRKKLFAPKISLRHFVNDNSFQRRRANFVSHGTELVSYLGTKMSDLGSMQSMHTITWASGVYISIKN